MKKTVQVLLAAYNGQDYLCEQLDSILAQKHVRVSLLVRNDGSTDQTGRILAAYEKKYPNISVYTGKNIGAARSFYHLLANAGAGADYYAFADQDDVWLEDKLARAVRLLEKAGQKNLPLLYAGEAIYASRDLKHREAFAYQNRKSASFGNALVENICMGCTQVFNRRLYQLVRGHLPDTDVMHDWWMYLSASYFGRVIYDTKPKILYRQHGNNQVGMHNHWGARWINRLRHIRQLRSRLSSQALEFQNAYQELLNGKTSNGKAALLELLCGYRTSRKKKCQLICSRSIYRQQMLDDAACRLLFLFGYL